MTDKAIIKKLNKAIERLDKTSNDHMEISAREILRTLFRTADDLQAISGALQMRVDNVDAD